MTYGERLLKAMTEAKMKRKELALALGCSVQILGMVITSAGNKERKLSVDNHSKAARILGVDPEWLSTGAGYQSNRRQDIAVSKSELSDEAMRLARLFDMIPEGEFLNRAVAYQSCTQSIINVLRSIEPAPTTAPKTPALS